MLRKYNFIFSEEKTYDNRFNGNKDQQTTTNFKADKKSISLRFIVMNNIEVLCEMNK